MKVKTFSAQTVRLASGRIDVMEEFTFLGSLVCTTCGTGRDVEVRLGKARAAFRLWTDYGGQRKLEERQKWRHSTPVWRQSYFMHMSPGQRTLDGLQHQQMLRKIINVHWPDRISNNELWNKTGEEPVQKCKRFGHTLRRSDDSVSKQAQGRRGRGRPRNTRGRDSEKEMWTEASGTAAWIKMEAAAQDKAGWSRVVYGLTHKSKSSSFSCAERVPTDTHTHTHTDVQDQKQ